jgi:predicted RNA methylase
VRPSSRITVECDVPTGVEFVAAGEVRERLASAERIGSAPGKLWFELASALVGDIATVRTLAGAWIVERFDGRRPTVLLADRRLADRIRTVARAGGVRTFTLSAPGAGSPAMREVRNGIAQATGLREADGGLLVRLRRRPGGWDALVAVGPRPLAERPWRVARTRGMLNGALAAAVVRLTAPRPDDRFLNVACGSGTLAIERRLQGPVRRVAAVDIAQDAVSATRVNARAAHATVAVVRADARRLPLATGAFDVLCADPPWGTQVGSHDGNVADYRTLLLEMGRVACRRARACVVSNETRLMQRVLGELASLWRLDSLVRVEQGGARPGVFVLRRA